MCGIVGYIGKKTNVLNIAKCLEKLEYRGYDSAGVCCHENQKLIAIKSVGKIEKLKQKLQPNLESSSIIAHTRWATHGEVTEQNCHPHLSFGDVWAVVHNGIIENYEQIKNNLTNKPISDTDTAVVSQLLAENNVQDIQGFIKKLNTIRGSFAIVAQCSQIANTMFVAKRKSPLYISKNKDGAVLVASDPICFAGFSKSYYVFADDEFARIQNSQIDFFDKTGKQIKKQELVLDNMFETATKQNYEHFMLKEIDETSVSIKRQVKFYQDNQCLKKFDREFISKCDKVVFVGCGTAYHAGLLGAKFVSRLSGVFAVAEIASEFLYERPVFVNEKTLCIFVSQSGETADTLGALKLAKENGATCVALTNVAYSSIARMADVVLPVCAGPEIAVASTKAYVCQLTALYMFASHLKNVLLKLDTNFYCLINSLAEKILKFDKEKIELLAEKISSRNDVIFIGKGCDFVTASEVSLKLKEVSYINSSSYVSGELKHGFLALVENGTPVIAIAGGGVSKQKTINAASEARSRGADVFVVSNHIDENTKDVLVIDELDDLLFGVMSIVPLQYLAYKVAVLKNLNPDQPRNLAKSVTVE